jgi:acyl-CoA dehydrogenase
MDFELSPLQKDLKLAAREFAEKEFTDAAQEYDRNEEFPRALWKKACDLGFIGTFIKEEYGGSGLGFTEMCLIMEEFWRVDPGIGNIAISAFGTEIVQEFGTEEQKKAYLSLAPSGKAIWGTAITEPDAGSDIFSVAASAKRSNGDYVINGTKMFISNGTVADFVVVFAVTNPGAADRKKRYSFFLVETDRPGFQAAKLRGKMGIRASDTAELSFSDVHVPARNLIGEAEGEGFRQVMYLFNVNRIVAASQGVGVAQGAFEKAVKHVLQRKAFGKRLSSLQGVRFMIAEMATRIEVARNTLRKACWLVDRGIFDPEIIAMAKLFAGQTGVYVANEALQLHGGYGYLSEYGVEHYYRDAKIVEIYEGAREVEKATIARQILGREE